MTPLKAQGLSALRARSHKGALRNEKAPWAAFSCVAQSLKTPIFGRIAGRGVLDLCIAHCGGLDGLASFKNEHGRRFSDAWDAFELGENEVAKGLHVANL